MSIELWGTFSVRDHLQPRAFVADVLLHNRLVIPTLPENGSENKWPAEWDLAKQKTLLSDLGELAVSIPWDEQRRATWQVRFDDERAEEHCFARAEITAAVEQDVAKARDPQFLDLPYSMTRLVLQDDVNHDADDRLLKKLRVTRKARPGSELEAVSAYPSFHAFAADMPDVGSGKSAEDTQLLSPTNIFGWQFFVPDSVDFGEHEDRKLLAKALKLATKTEFVEMREDFYKWWSDVVGSGISAAEAKEDIKKRISEYHKLMKGEGWRIGVRYAIKVLDAFSA